LGRTVAKTTHKIIYGDSAIALRDLQRRSADLLVTSPPYPMIEMWDALFTRLDPGIGEMLEGSDGDSAHEAMHRLLDRVWKSADSRMKVGSTACINIGDATRTMDGSFRLFPNHSRVGSSLLTLGYHALPEILWRKQSNKPNKFMGSGMLPPGAYVTQEHEYVMLYRKGEKREFHSEAELANRRRSAFFWEERNRWFSDVWEDVRGERQKMREGPRTRSAGFPFELAYRLVSMFSVRGDLVLDPFCGSGTTTLAAMATGRNSIGIEIEPELRGVSESRISGIVGMANEYNAERLRTHAELARGDPKMRYANEIHGFPVMTKQEKFLEVPMIASVDKVADDTFAVEYSENPVRFDRDT
jgi:modification methylase